MSQTETPPQDYVAWAKRANARWIVHHDLGRSAELYFDHLRINAPERLVPSCRNAYLMVELRDPNEDPKPWFYSGLFSLSTNDEAEIFLANHWLTRFVVRSARQKNTTALPANVSATTMGKIQCIQAAIQKLPGRAEG